MNFESDNTSPAHPKILAALTKASQDNAPSYGADRWMDAVRSKIQDIFDAPDAVIYLLPTGTSANALALGCVAEPWSTIFCTPSAHINVDECNGPEFFTSGAKLTLVGHGDRMQPAALRRAIEAQETRSIHGPKRGPVSITQLTEAGTAYRLDEIREICAVAKSYGLVTHMDGARLANAIAHLNCHPAEMSWKAGIDIVVFGGTKNGLLGAEAVVFFNPDHAMSFEYRRKRAGHLFSKHRYLSAQFDAYLKDNLWLDLAAHANACCKMLSDGLRQVDGIDLLYQVDANMIFASMPKHIYHALTKAGFACIVWQGDPNAGDPDERLVVRLVTAWNSKEADIARLIGTAHSV